MENFHIILTLSLVLLSASAYPFDDLTNSLNEDWDEWDPTLRHHRMTRAIRINGRGVIGAALGETADHADTLIEKAPEHLVSEMVREAKPEAIAKAIAEAPGHLQKQVLQEASKKSIGDIVGSSDINLIADIAKDASDAHKAELMATAPIVYRAELVKHSPPGAPIPTIIEQAPDVLVAAVLHEAPAQLVSNIIAEASKKHTKELLEGADDIAVKTAVKESPKEIQKDLVVTAHEDTKQSIVDSAPEAHAEIIKAEAINAGAKPADAATQVITPVIAKGRSYERPRNRGRAFNGGPEPLKPSKYSVGDESYFIHS